MGRTKGSTNKKEKKEQMWKTQPKKVEQHKSEEIESIAQVVADSARESVKELVKEKRKTMTISETKLGVTVVFNHEECKELGLDPGLMTREAVRQIKQKVGLAK